MFTTITNIATTANTMDQLISIYADLWEEAENFGMFFDDEDNFNNVTVYNDWLIAENRETGEITFIDPTDDSINFRHTGAKYGDLILITE